MLNRQIFLLIVIGIIIALIRAVAALNIPLIGLSGLYNTVAFENLPTFVLAIALLMFVPAQMLLLYRIMRSRPEGSEDNTGLIAHNGSLLDAVLTFIPVLAVLMAGIYSYLR